MNKDQTARASTDHDIDDLDTITADHDVAIAVIATAAHVAQSVADSLVAAAVTSTVSTPWVLTVPDGVHVRKVAVELQILSFLEWRKASSNGANRWGSTEQTVPR